MTPHARYLYYDVKMSKKLYSHLFSLPSYINGDLVLTREAALPAVTSMVGTW